MYILDLYSGSDPKQCTCTTWVIAVDCAAINCTRRLQTDSLQNSTSQMCPKYCMLFKLFPAHSFQFIQAGEGKRLMADTGGDFLLVKWSASCNWCNWLEQLCAPQLTSSTLERVLFWTKTQGQCFCFEVVQQNLDCCSQHGHHGFLVLLAVRVAGWINRIRKWHESPHQHSGKQVVVIFQF